MKYNEALIVFEEKVDSQGKGIPYHLDVFLEREDIREQVGTFYQTKSGLPREKIAQAISCYASKKGVESLVFSQHDSKGNKINSPLMVSEIMRNVSLGKKFSTRLQDKPAGLEKRLSEDEAKSLPELTPQEVVSRMKLDPFNSVYLNVHEDNLARYCAELADLGYPSIETYTNKKLENNSGRHVIGVRPNAS